MPEQKPRGPCGADGLTVPCRDYIHEMIRLNLKAVIVEIAAAKEAVAKADATMSTRLEGMNEFRSQMKDQVETFMPRNECETKLVAIDIACKSDIRSIRNTAIVVMGIGFTILIGIMAALVQIVQMIGNNKVP